MADWLAYKGQYPWLCDPVVDKVAYNEGSSITKSPRVSDGSPIWKVNQSGPAITDTHIPCGYWFKDYDSNSQLYRICFGLEMGYTKTNMVVDEQQTFYVKDSNGDTVDCQITTWTLDGVGSLSNSVGLTTVYTAPDYSEAGADSATITLWCGGAVKDTLVISIAHSCDCLDTIVYTSLQMSINQQQTLSASGMQSDECYSWAITSGGGSLSALTGKSVVYTAPASNANCLSNPTITLSCGGAVIDTITIAVNAYTDLSARSWYNVCDISNYGCFGASRNYCHQYLNCVGATMYWGYDIICNNYGCFGGNGCQYVACQPLPVGGDVRTEAMKENGCCPAALL